VSVSDRKKHHVDLTASGSADYEKNSGFERYDFVHNALPELAPNEIDTSVTILGRAFSAPLFISSMTGGYAGATAVNRSIARFCERHTLPFGVGSMRAMLENEALTDTFSVVRNEAPTSFIAANIGGAQLIGGLSDTHLNLIINTIRADAIIVHLNPLQELMQPEGDRSFRGVREGIKHLVETAKVPVIVKETGAGISGAVARVLYHECGIRCIDVAGAGGTSWSKVENLRKDGAEHDALLFDNWGIPTADCLIDLKTQHLPNLEIIASGGIKNVHDVVKSLCMGAKTTAMAGTIIRLLSKKGEDGLEEWYQIFKLHLRYSMCLLGAGSISDLGMHNLRRS
jgi:isopentenyl-diphosphate delta-isomerase